MGILNVTPDSFSDGGLYNKSERAIERALQMHRQGAAVIDIGGESTRPGAEEISTEEQIKRVIPVIEGIRLENKGLTISVDTTDVVVARAALQAGVNWINDISAGEASMSMLALAAESDVPIILMHRQGKSDRMQHNPVYADVCAEVKDYLRVRAELALDAGLNAENIILDPGIGFGKSFEHNLKLLADIESLVALGYPVLLGASRKAFLGEITQQKDAEKRVSATCATTALGVKAGVAIFRVHDVLENKNAMDVAWRIKTV
jgi:dihydropteroate synthase